METSGFLLPNKSRIYSKRHETVSPKQNLCGDFHHTCLARGFKYFLTVLEGFIEPVMSLRLPAVGLILLALLGSACRRSDRAAATPRALEFIPMPGNMDLPFSAAVRAGPVLYLSGQLGTDSAGRLVPGGIGPETAQALANIRALLEAQESGMDRVVKCTVMLADIAEWGAMNREYVRQFPTRPPARSAFATSGLALGARIELECLALAGPE
jgi:2-iminobutanoate/2-iminopropanoate deaminase